MISGIIYYKTSIKHRLKTVEIYGMNFVCNKDVR